MTQPEESDVIREWFTDRGWKPERISRYEGVEGWRWVHPGRFEEFYAVGSWDEPPAVTENMYEFMDSYA